MPVTATCETCGATAPMVQRCATFKLPKGWHCQADPFDIGHAWCSLKCFSRSETGVGVEACRFYEIEHNHEGIERLRTRGVDGETIRFREGGQEKAKQRYRERFGREHDAVMRPWQVVGTLPRDDESSAYPGWEERDPDKLGLVAGTVVVEYFIRRHWGYLPIGETVVTCRVYGQRAEADPEIQYVWIVTRQIGRQCAATISGIESGRGEAMGMAWSRANDLYGLEMEEGSAISTAAILSADHQRASDELRERIRSINKEALRRETP